MTMFEDEFPNYNSTVLVIKLEDINHSTGELFHKYLQFLQQFCTYTFNGMNSNSSNYTDSFLINLRITWIDLAQEYIYSKPATHNEFLGELNKIKLLKGKPLYKFAVCDIVMMTENPKASFEELKKCLPNYTKQMTLQDSKGDIQQFYDICQKILEKSGKMIGSQEIKNIEDTWSTYSDCWLDDIPLIIGKKSIIAYQKNRTTLTTKLESWLLSLSKMLSKRFNVCNHIIVQKLFEFKQNNDFNNLYQSFGSFIIIENDNISIYY